MVAESKPLISLIIPCYNEAAVIGTCHDRITTVIAKLNDYDFELLYVNDGSRDQTLSLLEGFAASDPRIRVINLSRNFGKEAAMTAALDHARGAAVIILDADLQDPPELIPDLIRIWRDEEADVVYGQRLSRSGESWFKRFTAAGFYRIINAISRVDIPVNTGDFRLMTRRVVDAINTLREHHRFMKGLFAWVGYKQVPLPYHRHPRAAGRTKWDYFKLWGFSIEGITGFSMTPLRLASIAGIVIAAFAFLFGSFVIIKTLIEGRDIPGYASMMVMMSFLSGIQLLSIGILGEYIGRVFDETKGRPLYLIDKIIEKPDKSIQKG